jgi:hypothetical protein
MTTLTVPPATEQAHLDPPLTADFFRAWANRLRASRAEAMHLAAERLDDLAAEWGLMGGERSPITVEQFRDRSRELEESFKKGGGR